MITYIDSEKVFKLDTDKSSYIFRILKTGQPENLHFGVKLLNQDFTSLYTKQNAGVGSTIAYDETDKLFSLDMVTLEYSGIGKGDYRHTPLEVKMPDGSYVTDFVYKGHMIYKGAKVSENELPFAVGSADEAETLEIEMIDKHTDARMILSYTVFASNNVIARNVKLVNNNPKPLVIRKIMSMCLDLPQTNYDLITFDGGWIREAHKHIRSLSYGVYVNESTTGASSNRHNPGIILAKKGTGEDVGECIGVNLIYSGNHYEAVDISNHDMLRVMTGINPHCFEWTCKNGESFCTPQAIISFSNEGLNGLSGNMHEFVQKNIVRGKFRNQLRPILLNNWEAHFFDFNYFKLVKLAKQSARLGMELFVLDDGWFKSRNSDTAGLGDYAVNRKKLPGGLKRLAKKINSLNMKFGLWLEPEMVNIDSDLYRAHPEFAVAVPSRKPTLGRNQLVLDLCKSEVRDYICKQVNSTLKSANIEYVKWDMNRHISDIYSSAISNQGEFFHRYILGLYEVLKRIVSANENVLFESCSSGGNRFDLGMLCFTPQIWASDDTDAVERLSIQGGLSHLYPTAAIASHVSMSPHQQTLRRTPLSTRFNVASMFNLGYELDIKYLSKAEKKEVKGQIEFYKKWRETLQYGRFYRFDEEKPYRINWQKVGRQGSILGNFQTLSIASPSADIVKFKGLDDAKKYSARTMPQGISVKSFGGLIKHALPIKVHPDGLIMSIIDKNFRLKDCEESYVNYGDVLRSGIKLNQHFMGTWYNNTIRLLGDYGSSLYTVEEVETLIKK